VLPTAVWGAERDRDSDERRVSLIQKIIRSAVAEAEAEAAGLRVRMLKARRSAIFLVEYGEGGEPDARRRGEITNLEGRLFAGEQRLTQSKNHVEFLRSIEVAATRVPHTADQPTAGSAARR
jgi:hypothetical protein